MSESTPLEGLIILEPTLHRDARGVFHESFSAERFERDTGLAASCVQDNHAISRRGAGANAANGFVSMPAMLNGDICAT